MINHTDVLTFGAEIRAALHDGEAMLDGVVYRKVVITRNPAGRDFHACMVCPLAGRDGSFPRPCGVLTGTGNFPCNANISGAAGGAIVDVSTIPSLTMKGVL